MAEILTTTGSAHKIEQLIHQARERLVIVSPFLQVPQVWLERLIEASSRGVAVTIVCRGRDLRAEERKRIASVPRITLRTMEHLHAKCYLNEQGVVISSLNLYEASQGNREMGVYFDAAEPPYADALREVNSIILASSKSGLNAPNLHHQSSLFGPVRRRVSASGFCIRCRGTIREDTARPLCIECYQTWAQFGNDEYPERYCHACGDDEVTTIARPLCAPCFRG